MGLGDAALPVPSDVEANNPVASAGLDSHDQVDKRLIVLERSGNTELARQVKYLFDTLAGEGALTGDYTYPPV